jgi:hypothetical protein
MFALFGGSGGGAGPAELLTATVVPAGGGSPLFTLNWTKSGNVSAYSIYIGEVVVGGSPFNSVYGPINPNLLTFAGDVSTFPDYTPGDNPNMFEFEVSLVAAGPTQALGSPIYLLGPY